MTDPNSDLEDRLHAWTVVLQSINLLQEGIDDGEIDVEDPEIRATPTSTLAVGETLVRDLPGQANVLAAQIDLRSRYNSWYFVDKAIAEKHLKELFDA
ncbi:hypothetical protein DB346_06430 [Verrucomicrobia bacterium LW23]|nr:hypothetical protein DB346_06430 [Verrucomicrobia bacterium LW23]